MTLDLSPVYTALANVQSEHIALLDSQRADYEQIVADRDAEIERLKALIPAPSKPTTLFGVNASDASQHRDHAAKFGPNVGMWRYFHQPGEGIHYPPASPKANDRFDLKPGEHFCYSWKVPPGQLTEAMVLPALRAAPTDRPFYVCAWHEPTGELVGGQFTKADYDKAFRVLRAAADKVGPHIRVTAIMEGWNWFPESRRDPEAYLPPPETYDVLGVDVYFDGVIGRTVRNIPTEFDPMIATAKKFGKAWAAPELGIGTKVTGQARLDALTLLARTVQAKGAEFACYFDNDTWALDTKAAAAWKAGATA